MNIQKMIILRWLLFVGMMVSPGVICASGSPTIKRQLSTRMLERQKQFGGLVDQKRIAEQEKLLTSQSDGSSKQTEVSSISEVTLIPEINETHSVLTVLQEDDQRSEKFNNKIVELEQQQKKIVEELQQKNKRLTGLMRDKELALQTRAAEEQNLQRQLEASQTTHNSLQQKLKEANESLTVEKSNSEELQQKIEELDELLRQARIMIEKNAIDEESLKKQHDNTMERISKKFANEAHEIKDSNFRYRVACMLFLSILLILVLDKWGVKIPIISG